MYTNRHMNPPFTRKHVVTAVICVITMFSHLLLPCVSGQSPNTPLVELARANNLKGLNNALIKGVSPDQRGKGGETALMATTIYKNTSALQMLLQAGANVNAVDNDGYTALSMACLNERPRSVHLLLEHRADVNHEDRYGWTVLEYAIMHSSSDNLAIIRDIIQHHANVNHRRHDNEGTPLMMASSGYGKSGDIYLNIIKALIIDGANVNAKTKQGGTALMGAASHGNEKIVRLLLANHADPNVQNKSGKTALMYATQKKYVSIVKLLQKAIQDYKKSKLAGTK